MSTNHKILKDKVAIITGAGRGIGRAAADLFAEQGACVVLVSRTANELNAACESINASGGRAVPFAMDVSDPASAQRLVEFAISTFNGVDILVNNASVLAPFGMTWTTDPEAWLRLFKINVFGTYLCTREVLPIMLRQNYGRIVTVSSGVATYNLTGTSAYNSSKAAIERFSGTVAEEVKDSGVVVTTMRPSKVQTAMQAEIRGQKSTDFPRVNEWVGVYERGELLDPIVPAQGLLWLCSQFAHDANGQLFDIKESEFIARIEADIG